VSTNPGGRARGSAWENARVKSQGKARGKSQPPLPVRDGLGPARVTLLGGAVLAELAHRFGEAAADKVRNGEVLTADGSIVTASTVLPPNSPVYLYRDLPVEVTVPFDIPILYRDRDIVVVDKPHFLATMPRGRHVAQTALVRLRRELDLPELSPAHRLDRLTAGVLLFTVRREVRGAYQSMFAEGLVRKTYLAHAPVDADLEFPVTVRSRIIKQRGHLQAVEVPGVTNAETLVEHRGDGNYRLTPRTGRTHQLRVHMASLGLPITGDPLYPDIIDVDVDDFSTPLSLLAHRLEFQNPMTGDVQRFTSGRALSRHLSPYAGVGGPTSMDGGS
jgi:tRNA pseudouridine32 synthase / 23S rRNA pseudouridine746 synthase